MGLAPEGQGARVIADGIVAKDGRLPINPSGGLKAKGHPIGATGVSMHALASMQLAGTAGDMQIKDARLGGIFNMGGAAVANYVSVLERLRSRALTGAPIHIALRSRSSPNTSASAMAQAVSNAAI